MSAVGFKPNIYAREPSTLNTRIREALLDGMIFFFCYCKAFGIVRNTLSSFKIVVQVAVCLISNTALLPSGMTLGFTAVALPYMLQPNDLFHVDSDQASWIGKIIK